MLLASKKLEERYSNNDFTYQTDGNKLKTFSKNKFHKKTYDIGKNNESEIPLVNKIKGKSHRREKSIRNQFESQIVFN